MSMDVNCYKQGPRTAGISIFHDGLPKLASVHCYDRGNVATFGLQSCQPKRQVEFPIRPIPNQISTKGSLMNHQRVYVEPKRPVLQQSKIYSGAFYPPGSQPRLQFVDGRPIIIPSSFDNKFVSKECFDPTINKSKTVIYNESNRYYNCCGQYTLDSVHKCTDDIIKRPIPNRMPELTYHCPYMVANDVTRDRLNSQEHSPSKSFPITDVMGSFHHTQCKTISPPEYLPSSHCSLFRPVNPAVRCNKNPPVLIDLDKSSDNEKEIGSCEFNSSSTKSTEPVNNFSGPICAEHNGNTTSNVKQCRKQDSLSRPRNIATFRCNSCQVELPLLSSHTYIDNSSTSLSTHRFSSNTLCTYCAKKSRMWDSMKNLPGESQRHHEYDTSHDYTNSCGCRGCCANRGKYIYRDLLVGKRHASNKSPIVIDLESRDNHVPDTAATNSRSSSNKSNVQERAIRYQDGYTAPTETVNCACCWHNNDFNGNQDRQFLKDTQPSSCSDCTKQCHMINANDHVTVQSNGTMRASANHSSTTVNESSDTGNLADNPVVINLTDLSDDEEKQEKSADPSSKEINYLANGTNNQVETTIGVLGGRESLNSETTPTRAKHDVSLKDQIKIKPESVDSDNTTIILQMEQKNAPHHNIIHTNVKDDDNCEISLELDIDEKSFESFINNCQKDNCLQEEVKAPTQITVATCLDSNNNSQSHQHNRKRKLSCPDLQVCGPNDSNIPVPHQLDERDCKSYPPSPNHLINEAQLQVLKAKNRIRQNSVDNESEDIHRL